MFKSIGSKYLFDLEEFKNNTNINIVFDNEKEGKEFIQYMHNKGIDRSSADINYDFSKKNIIMYYGVMTGKLRTSYMEDLIWSNNEIYMPYSSLIFWNESKTNGSRSKLIIISGASATGKDTIAKKLSNVFIPLTSHTTRPMRNGESEGNPYYFISDEDFEAMSWNGEFIEHRVYKGEWHYGLSKTEIDLVTKITGNYSVILDATGKDSAIEYIRENNLLIDVTTVFITANKQQRLLRSLQRQGDMKDEEVEEVLRRLRADEDEITPHMNEYDIILKNNTEEELERNLRIIKELI